MSKELSDIWHTNELFVKLGVANFTKVVQGSDSSGISWTEKRNKVPSF
ncbi:hypothetical protein Ngar_c34050 [Candidatus Nitrososphaera gargensis Ga9.2]|uniref:Uncharacterized protein n=1 Tax=Nitrososphaera gargensis (strain Ga9.2) TaxID=1237085 RepID=K0IJR4_NITGG|nr:hypothetical protein [Candidatus Nitrososphaera gargensis]AFU60320.1 hypothetical protein Ngar_c34050 [Candidatus Nitrososphaera gargensis Ga9.2]